MIPVASSTPVPGAYIDTVSRRKLPLEDWERGGVAVGDASQGLETQMFHLVVTSSGAFTITDESGVVYSQFTRAGVLQAALAFDSLMQPVYAWVDAGGAFLRYFDASASGYTILPIPGATNLRLTLDDHRRTSVGISDVILAYKVGTDLRARVQRENYAVEHVVATGKLGALIAIGLTTQYRLQFSIQATS